MSETVARSRLWLVSGAVLLAVGIAWLAWSGESTGEPTKSAGAEASPAPVAADRSGEQTLPRDVVPSSVVDRWRVPEGVLQDPLFRSGLGSIRGRLVDEDGRSLPGLRVEFHDLYSRHAIRSEDMTRVELPWEHGKTLSGLDGRFAFSGVDPFAQPILLVGAGSGRVYRTSVDATVDQDTVPPGGTLDLGDLVVARAAAIVGRVLLPDGRPAAGALVYAELGSHVLIREIWPIYTPGRSARLEKHKTGFAVRLPGPPGGLFDENIDRTTTDANGRFRLDGLRAGTNELTVHVADAFVPFGQRVECVAGETADVGTMQVHAGRTLRCRVVDGEGAAVADAEVIVARSNRRFMHLEYDLGVVLGERDAEGRLTVRGYPMDRVTLAARRPGRPWTVLYDVPTEDSNTIMLQPSLDLGLRVTGAAGEVQVRVEAMHYARGRLGIHPSCDGALDLTGRLTRVANGEYQIAGLARGDYRVGVFEPSTGLAGRIEVKLDASKAVSVALRPTQHLRVHVVEGRGQPVRFARVELGRVQEGWTDAAGRVEIETTGRNAEDVWILVEHPAFASHSSDLTKLQGDLQVRLLGHCVLNGRVSVASAAATFRGWQVDLHAVGDDEYWSNTETIRVDREGRFRAVLPKPGRYKVWVMDGIERSVDVEVRGSGGDEFVVREGRQSIDLTATWTAPAVRSKLSGVVTIDGVPAAGVRIENYLANRLERGKTRTDADGRFDLGDVYQETVTLRIPGESQELWFGTVVWEAEYATGPRPLPEIRIDLRSGSASGRVLGQDGEPRVGATVWATGRLSIPLAKGPAETRTTTTTDATGRFTFPRLAAGDYSFSVRVDKERGVARRVAVRSGIPLEDVVIRVLQMVAARGRVDTSGLRLGAIDGKLRRSIRLRGPVLEIDGAEDDGTFEFDDLVPGQYSVELLVWGSGLLRLVHPEPLQLTATGASDLALRFGEESYAGIEEQAKAAGFNSSDAYLRSLGLERVKK